MRSPDQLKIWETAAHYQLVHSLALLFVGIRAGRHGSGLLSSGALFGTGIVLFSGSLYTLVLTQNRKWGAVTPIGGLCLIGGWVTLMFG